MNKFRVGESPIMVSWHFLLPSGEPFDISSYSYSLYYRNGRGQQLVSSTALSGEDNNILSWTMSREEQREAGAGVYDFRLVIDGFCMLNYRAAFGLRSYTETEQSYDASEQDDNEGQPILVTIYSSVNLSSAGGDYAGLDNKPKINGVTLVGNRTSDELGLSGEITVTFTMEEFLQEPVTADKTVAEIVQAVKDGKSVRAKILCSSVPGFTGYVLLNGVQEMDSYKGVTFSFVSEQLIIGSLDGWTDGGEDNWVCAYGVPEFVGATADSPGRSGFVPEPSSSDRNKFLAGDGTWKDILPEIQLEIVKDESEASGYALSESSKATLIALHNADPDNPPINVITTADIQDATFEDLKLSSRAVSAMNIVSHDPMLEGTEAWAFMFFAMLIARERFILIECIWSDTPMFVVMTQS